MILLKSKPHPASEYEFTIAQLRAFASEVRVDQDGKRTRAWMNKEQLCAAASMAGVPVGVWDLGGDAHVLKAVIEFDDLRVIFLIERRLHAVRGSDAA